MILPSERPFREAYRFCQFFCIASEAAKFGMPLSIFPCITKSWNASGDSFLSDSSSEGPTRPSCCAPCFPAFQGLGVDLVAFSHLIQGLRAFALALGRAQAASEQRKNDHAEGTQHVDQVFIGKADAGRQRVGRPPGTPIACRFRNRLLGCCSATQR